MRTSVIALGLAIVAPATGFAQSPRWQTDYGAAQQQAASQQKPVAIVFGSGPEGWQQLGGGSLTSEAARILGDKYVACYVDTATTAGQALARRCELSGSVGLVISDRSGNLQAFWHEGVLSADALANYLNKYAAPNRGTTTTETNPPQTPASYYPPTQLVTPRSFTPMIGFPSAGPAMGGAPCRT
jgi:hypothetical protein